MKKRDQFVFHTRLSPQEVTELLPDQVKAYTAAIDSEIRYCETSDGFAIGLGRVSHHAGYWYNATIDAIDGLTVISGKIEYDDPFGGKTPWYEWLGMILLISLFSIPIALCFIGVRLYRLIKRIPKDKTEAEKLVELMTRYMNCTLVEENDE